MASIFFIIAITSLTSILAFSDVRIFAKFIFNAVEVVHKKQYYRLVTYGLLHANWVHLFFNMFVLYSFGQVVVSFYEERFGQMATISFIVFYILALIVSTLADLFKHKDHEYYNALGASGAVAAVVFSSIILYPYSSIGILFIPFGIPAPLFGLLYLGYSWHMGKREADNIGHNAHFWGALFGLVFTAFIFPSSITGFIEYLLSIF